jgi:hypothetical protein
MVGDSIVVTLLGYSYAVTFYKPKGSPSLGTALPITTSGSN